jgi:hypothetical protein
MTDVDIVTNGPMMTADTDLPHTLATVVAATHRPSVGDSPILVAIAGKTAVALVGLEPTRPGAKDFKSGTCRSTVIHWVPLSSP